MISLPTGYTFRPVTVADAHQLAQHRAAMFLEMGRIPQADVEPLTQASIPWFQKLLNTGGYVGWFVLKGDEVVAGGGIHLRELAPMPGTYRMGTWGHIVNVFTNAAHRRRGIARCVMLQLLEWVETEKIDRISLTAAPVARPLYESLGFTVADDMELKR